MSLDHSTAAHRNALGCLTLVVIALMALIAGGVGAIVLYRALV